MGSHQPPTNRSFYLSLAASTLRFAIIVALVIGGIVVIDQAFPAQTSGGEGDGSDLPITGGTVGATGETGETGAAGATPTGATGTATEPSPTIVGVRIAVFNGTEVSGLAGETQTKLVDEYGYIATQDPADAPAAYPVTTIYFNAPKDKVEAEYLASDFFKKLDGVEVVKLEPGTADIDPSTQLAIFLGTDYATLTST
ncbi:MAG: LytR C-terminal domain-containing protein [Actinomycetota bacterium]